MSELIDRERFSADMRDFQNRVGIWRDEAEDTETWTRADAALATIIETKLILDKQPTIAAPRWVRCEDVLPEIGQRVIVYDGWMQFMTRKDDQRLNGKMYWENEEGNWERVDDEAYWMPIEPPKEEEHGN